MNATELLEIRGPVQVDPLVEKKVEAEGPLAAEVSAELGYDVYRKHVVGKSLGAVLNELGIGVIPTAQVEAYKRKKAQEALRAPMLDTRRPGISAQMDVLVRNTMAQMQQPFPLGLQGLVFDGASRAMAWWPETALENYPGVVPRQALADALRIKRRLPDATFVVHHLEARTFDPFLQVRCGDQAYYLYVWDEPDFDA